MRWLCYALFAWFVAWPARAWAIDVPPLQAHVNDNAGMLGADDRAQLEQKLADYEHKTGRQFALLTVDTLDGDPIENFSIRVVETWKLGRKAKDDGLLLLVVKNDRKLRIEVGYGLEGTITDAFTASITRNVIAPAFRAGNVASGLEQAFDLLMQKAAGEDVAAPPGATDPTGRNAAPLGWLALLLIVAPFLIPLLFLRARGRGRWGGGGGGWGGFGGGGFGGGGFGGGGSGGGGYSGGGGGFGGGGSSGSW